MEWKSRNRLRSIACLLLSRVSPLVGLESDSRIVTNFLRNRSWLLFSQKTVVPLTFTFLYSFPLFPSVIEDSSVKWSLFSVKRWNVYGLKVVSTFSLVFGCLILIQCLRHTLWRSYLQFSTDVRISPRTLHTLEKRILFWHKGLSWKSLLNNFWWSRIFVYQSLPFSSKHDQSQQT